MLFSAKVIKIDAITLVYNVREITVGNDNGSFMLRTISIRSDNYSIQHESVM
jgi:hypothetical protein